MSAQLQIGKQLVIVLVPSLEIDWHTPPMPVNHLKWGKSQDPTLQALNLALCRGERTERIGRVRIRTQINKNPQVHIMDLRSTGWAIFNSRLFAMIVLGTALGAERYFEAERAHGAL